MSRVQDELRWWQRYYQVLADYHAKMAYRWHLAACGLAFAAGFVLGTFF